MVGGALGLVTGNPAVALGAVGLAQAAAPIIDRLTQDSYATGPVVLPDSLAERVQAVAATDEEQAAGLALAERLLANPPLTPDEWLAALRTGPDEAAARIVASAVDTGSVSAVPAAAVEVARAVIAHTYQSNETVLVKALLGRVLQIADAQDALAEAVAADFSAAREEISRLSAAVDDLLAHPLARTPRVVVGLRPQPPPVFQTRSQAQAEIDAVWAGSGNQAVVLTQAVPQGAASSVVRGDGGVGKSQLARWYFDASDAPVKVWADASRIGGLVSAYAAAARGLGQPGENEAELSAWFRAWLSSGTEWFVVLDDLDVDPGEVASWWPPRTATGRTLATTRRREAGYDAADRVMVDLDVYTPEEAESYVTDRLAAHAADLPTGYLAEVRDLVTNLHRHPVALNLATAVIADEQLTVAAYRRRLADRTRTLADVLPGQDAPYQRTIAATWSIALDRATDHHSEHAPAMAALLAHAHPTLTPRCLFLSEAARGFLASFANSEDDPLTEDQASQALTALRLVSLVATGPDPWAPVAVHALAQRTIRESLDEIRRTDAALTLADAAAQVWGDAPPAAVVGLQATAQTLLDLAGPVLACNESHNTVLFRTGNSIGESGRPADAVAYFEDLLERLAPLGPDHPGTLVARHNIARWRGESGDVAGALAALQEVLDDRVRVLGPDHPSVLTTSRNLEVVRHRLATGAQGAAGRAQGNELVGLADLTDAEGTQADSATDEASGSVA